MEIQNFIEKFSEQLEMDENVLDTSTKYRELDEWASLAGLNVLAMIDEEYGVALNPDEMRKTSTIQELFDLIQSKQ